MFKFKTVGLADLLERVIGDAENSGDNKLLESAQAAQRGESRGLMDVYEHLHGKDADEDCFTPNDEAMMCLQEAFDMGDPAAIGVLGEIEVFDETEKFIPEGLELLLKSKNAGYDGAGATLANFWHNGQCEKEEKGHFCGDPLSAYDYFSFGFFYYHGIEVERDLKKAKRYFHYSLIFGCADARKMLGLIPESDAQLISALHLCNEGDMIMGDMNSFRALRLYLEAARMGDNRGMSNTLWAANELGCFEDYVAELGERIEDKEDVERFNELVENGYDEISAEDNDEVVAILERHGVFDRDYETFLGRVDNQSDNDRGGFVFD